MIKKKIDHFVL